MRQMRPRPPLPLTLAALLAAACAGAGVLVEACKQPAPAVVDAGAPAPAATDAAPTFLTPLDEDAAPPVDAAVAVVHKPGGAGLSVNQARAKQCCNALKAQAGTDPILAGLVAQCNTIAMQMGPSTGGEAPEFAPLRAFLKGKNMPAICQGL